MSESKNKLKNTASTIMKWGSLEWFTWKFISQGYEDPSAYFAHHNNGYQRYRHRCLTENLREALPNILPGLMLDIGCGIGYLTQLVFNQHNFKAAIGVDFVYPLIQQAKKVHPEISFTVGRLPYIGFSKNSFNLIIASEVLYYLNEQDRAKALKEIYRLLKDNGIFLFSSALGDKYFTSRSAREFIENRFKIEKLWYDNNRLYHILMRPINILNNLKHHLISGNRFAHFKYSYIFINHSELFNNSFFRLCLNTTCFMTYPFKRSEIIPRVLGRFSKKLLPNQTKTNVTILARKAST